MASTIILGKQEYNTKWFKQRTQDEAVKTLGHAHGIDKIINAWKQANGKSVPNRAKSKK